jgi:uncharacterized membrane protein YbhN (UPF0104 family)
MTRVRHPMWRRLRHVAFAAFLVLVAVLLVRAARGIAWHEVWAVLRALQPSTLALGLGLTAASYLVYGGYDLAGRAYAVHALPARRVLAIAAVAYAFALNIGALIGGAGFRLRMYAHEGVPLGKVTRVIVFAAATNWIGYLVLAGALLASGRVSLPPALAVHGLEDATVLRALGGVMLALGVGYLVACRATHGRIFHVRGHHFRFPSVRLALLQIALSVLNWSLMGAVVHTFLPQAGYAAVLTALLLASVATAMVHIPSGIGVLEAVFIAMLGHVVPAPRLIAALLAYRACYYLVPLACATLGFAVMELRGRRATLARPIANG